MFHMLPVAYTKFFNKYNQTYSFLNQCFEIIQQQEILTTIANLQAIQKTQRRKRIRRKPIIKQPKKVIWGKRKILDQTTRIKVTVKIPRMVMPLKMEDPRQELVSAGRLDLNFCKQYYTNLVPRDISNFDLIWIKIFLYRQTRQERR